jgi:hypothetical protein
MKRSRRRSSSSPVTLFPFLAVLISTMGALILLLLSISRQVSEQNLAAALAHVLDRVRADEESLASRRAALASEIAGIDQRLAATQSDGKSIEQALLRRDQQARSDQARLQASQRELDEARSRREQISRELISVQRRLAKLTADNQRLNDLDRDAGNSFVPVVHPGSNGTVRRPIFIECTKDGVILQPEAVAIPVSMLDDEAPGVNSLARAVRALSAYHTRRLQTEDGDQPAGVAAAYPLLLVRPDGIRPFYAARQSLEEIGTPFGYELVEAQWSLQFPEPDPEARAIAIAAIRSATYDGRERGRVASEVPHGLTPARGPGLVSSPPAGATSWRDPRAGAGDAAIGSPLATGAGGGATGAANADGLDAAAATADEPARTQQPIGWSNRTHVASDSESVAVGNGGDVPIDTTAPVKPAVPNTQEPPQRPADDVTSRYANRSGASTRAATASNAANGENGDQPIGWQLPGGASSGRRIPIARRVEIACASDFLVVGSAGAVVHLSAQRMDETAARLVEEIEREVMRWGPPGSMFWWRPELHFHVRPDAIENYYRIRIALAGSSAAVSHEIVWDDRPGAVTGDFLGRVPEPVQSAWHIADRFWE